MKELPADIVSRTTIEFKDRITRESLEDLFGYLAKELPLGEIKYSEHITTYRGDRFAQFKDRKAKRIERLSGIIASGERVVEFEMYKDYEKTPYVKNIFDGLRFITAPGYELDELRKEEVELIDKVRELIEIHDKCSE